MKGFWKMLMMVALSTAFLLPGGELCAASSYGLPDGWTEVRPNEGRQVAVLHNESLTRMEAWRVKLAERDLEQFRATLERRLKRKGFRPAGESEAELEGYRGKAFEWEKTFQDQVFVLRVLEVQHRGELWQFSSVFVADDGASRWSNDLKTFARAVLSPQ